MLNRRIFETIGVRYSDLSKMQSIVADVHALLSKHEDVDQNKTLIVNFDAFNASSVDFFIYTFTKTINWVEYHGVKQKILLEIADIIAGHGAEIAFPTSTIHLETVQPES
jgi:MscS family membrane protein